MRAAHSSRASRSRSAAQEPMSLMSLVRSSAIAAIALAAAGRVVEAQPATSPSPAPTSNPTPSPTADPSATPSPTPTPSPSATPTPASDADLADIEAALGQDAKDA